MTVEKRIREIILTAMNDAPSKKPTAIAMFASYRICNLLGEVIADHILRDDEEDDDD